MICFPKKRRTNDEFILLCLHSKIVIIKFLHNHIKILVSWIIEYDKNDDDFLFFTILKSLNNIHINLLFSTKFYSIIFDKILKNLA